MRPVTMSARGHGGQGDAHRPGAAPAAAVERAARDLALTEEPSGFVAALETAAPERADRD